ncbi:hypothetical protein [Nocardia jinanensis]|uniref:Uncharacterized protein n=1 Tax=Nocardia jinanensis TaxID=382504 RepID=A0A917RUV2_9NOCA|nr:hypothetical protein [Nocardia jinanensis]GGL34958.1 hypothetical protein GCM10011588_57070 [Nocardia jinanensis]
MTTGVDKSTAAQSRAPDADTDTRPGKAPAKVLPGRAAAPERSDGRPERVRRDDGPRWRPGRWGRSLPVSLFAVMLTPVAIGIAANSAVTGGRWWDTGDRWLSPAQSVLGAVLLLVVAGLAMYEPAAGVVAGVVWGIAPAVVQIVAPRETYRLISASPGLPADLARALHTWLSSGVVLVFGVLLAGIGIIAALRRRRLPG